MKPKTQLQKRIVSLSESLPTITDEQKQWGYDNCLDRYATVSRQTFYCLECGYSCRNPFTTETKVTCPECKSKVEISKKYSGRLEESVYFSIVTTIEDYQVVRHIYLYKKMKKKEKPSWFSSEVVQIFIDKDGKSSTMSKGMNGFGGYSADRWIHWTELEVRPRTFKNCSAYNIHPWKVYPKVRTLPIFKRNGIKKTFYDLSPQGLFSAVLEEPIVETLIKAKQVGLLNAYSRQKYNVKKYWATVKICIRNGYIIKDASLYFDYLDLLEYFGKDLHNSKFVCPENYKEQHNVLLRRKTAIRERRDREAGNDQALKAQILKNKRLYVELRQQYFDLKFTDGNLTVTVMRSVKQFQDEGKLLEHCVFEQGYYSKTNSLIFSARVDGVPVETVEVLLDVLKVNQSRGFDNDPSKYNKQIVKLVTENLHKIKNCNKKQPSFQMAS